MTEEVYTSNHLELAKLSWLDIKQSSITEKVIIQSFIKKKLSDLESYIKSLSNDELIDIALNDHAIMLNFFTLDFFTDSIGILEPYYNNQKNFLGISANSTDYFRTLSPIIDQLAYDSDDYEEVFGELKNKNKCLFEMIAEYERTMQIKLAIVNLENAIDCHWENYKNVDLFY